MKKIETLQANDINSKSNKKDILNQNIIHSLTLHHKENNSNTNFTNVT